MSDSMTIGYNQVQSQFQPLQPQFQQQNHQNPFNQPQTTQNPFDFQPHQQNQQRRRVMPDLIRKKIQILYLRLRIF